MFGEWQKANSTLTDLAVSVLAGYLPARRASKVDPMVALHQQQLYFHITSPPLTPPATNSRRPCESSCFR